MWWKGSTAALLSKGPPSLPCSHFFFFHLILSYTHPKIFFKMHHFTMRFKQGHHSPHHFLHIYICVKKITPFLGKNRTFRFFGEFGVFVASKKVLLKKTSQLYAMAGLLPGAPGPIYRDTWQQRQAMGRFGEGYYRANRCVTCRELVTQK